MYTRAVTKCYHYNYHDDRCEYQDELAYIAIDDLYIYNSTCTGKRIITVLNTTRLDDYWTINSLYLLTDYSV